MDRFDSVLRRESPHYQSQLTVGCSSNGSPINPLNVLGGLTTPRSTFAIHLIVFVVCYRFFRARYAYVESLSVTGTHDTLTASQTVATTSGSSLYDLGHIDRCQRFATLQATCLQPRHDQPASRAHPLRSERGGLWFHLAPRVESHNLNSDRKESSLIRLSADSQ